MGSLRALAALLLGAAFLITQIDAIFVAAFVLPLVAGLIAIHVDRDGGQLARLLVAGAVRLLPEDRREDHRDEWLDHVAAAGEHGILPLGRALSIALIAVPMLAVGLRIGRAKRISR